MKKNSMKFFLLFLTCFSFAVEINTSVVMSPVEAFVGDEIILNCAFSSSVEIPIVQEEYIFNTTFLTDISNDSLSVTKAILSKKDLNYQLQLHCIPWKSGTITIESFSLSPYIETLPKPFIIKIPFFEIQSVIAKTGKNQIQKSKAPVLIPGTTWIVYGFVILAFLLLAGLIVVIVKLEAVTGFFTLISRRFSLSKMYRKLDKGLLHLEQNKEQITDTEFATNIVLLVRTYLAFRFSPQFTKITSMEIISFFDELTGNTTSDTAKDNIEQLSAVFVRCDFLRFAGEASYKAPLTSEEKSTLIEKVRNICKYFEKEEDNNETE
jgi:hypothetical protein